MDVSIKCTVDKRPINKPPKELTTAATNQAPSTPNKQNTETEPNICVFRGPRCRSDGLDERSVHFDGFSGAILNTALGTTEWGAVSAAGASSGGEGSW